MLYSEFGELPPEDRRYFYHFEDKKHFNKFRDSINYDHGKGIPKPTENNLTIQDLYKNNFLLFEEACNNYGAVSKKYDDISQNMLRNVACCSELSKLFFSDRNIQRIQKLLRKEIEARTGGKFKLEEDQDETRLLIVMRAVYLEFGRYLPNQIVRQVKELNKKTVEETVPGMMTELRQHYQYLYDINTPIRPMLRPLNVSNAGRRSLPGTANSLF